MTSADFTHTGCSNCSSCTSGQLLSYVYCMVFASTK